MNRIIAVAIALAVPSVLNAQTIDACYVKNTGTMYRVKAANSPTQCSNNHIPFSWNQVGPTGPQGIQGAVGPQGPAGPSGVSGYQLRETTAAPLWMGVVQVRSIYCAAGEVILGGGFRSQVQHDDMQVVYSGPVRNSFNYYGWEVKVRNTSASVPVTLVLNAICAKVGS